MCVFKMFFLDRKSGPVLKKVVRGGEKWGKMG